MSDLNLEKYTKQKKEREKNKKRCYKSNLAQVNTMITNSMDRLNNNISYEIPVFIFGEVDYDPTESALYIVKKLTKNLVFKRILTDIKILEPNILYIEWDLSKI